MGKRLARAAWPRGLAAVSIAVAMAAQGLLTAPVGADPWGTNTSDTGAHPDGSSHSFCWQPMDDSAKQNIASAAYNALGAPTDAVAKFDEECDYSGGTETDVSWDTVNLPGTTRGQAFCEDFDDGRCDQFYAELDLAELRQGGNDEIDITKTACHEFGHTVGLTHHDDGYGCMKSGSVPSTELRWRRYGDHHKGHINAWF